jgi:hypothetical protein
VSKIVLAYADKYWNPDIKPKDGIGLVAQTLHNSISETFEPDEFIYCDFADYGKLRGIKGVDHLFTISGNIDRFIGILQPTRTTLISVNEHALFRRSVRDLAKSRGVPSSYLGGHDGIHSNLKETHGVDSVMGFGGWNLFSSYVLAGVNPQLVFPIGWKYWDSFRNGDSLQGNKEILFYPGVLCFRKGVDFVEPFVQFLIQEFPEYKLKIAGFPVSETIADYLMNLIQRYPKNLVWVNERINYGEENWIHLASNTAFAIFPSFEEGLSGCAMDVINLGIPLIHSDKIGIEISHEVISELEFMGEWKLGIRKIINGGPELWNHIRHNQRNSAFHQFSNNNSVTRLLERIRSGQVWPSASISSEIFQGAAAQEMELSTMFKSPSASPDYLISKTAGVNDIAGIELNYNGNNPLDELQKIQMALYVLEKHNYCDSLFMKDYDGLLVRKASPIGCESGLLESKVELWISEYSNEFIRSGKSLGFYRVREQLYNISFGVIYRVKRSINIVRLKIKLEIQRIVHKIQPPSNTSGEI